MNNQNTSHLHSEVRTKDFISEIRASIRAGYSVSPFIGSGMSSPSGILMGQDFNNYLAHSVCKVIRGNWDIRRQGWPELPNQAEHDGNRGYILQEFKRICGDLGIEVNESEGRIVGFYSGQASKAETHSNSMIRPLVPSILGKSARVERQDWQRQVTAQRQDQLASLLKPSSNPNLSPTSTSYVVETGIRNLFDWRATLEFLASVATRRPSGEDRSFVTMGAYDSSVIDSFNRQITAGRKPNLGHKMLAHLSRPLRSRFVLTTNFDNLIEQALQSIGIHPQVLDVRTGGEIPAPSTVRAESSVVKLHGSLVETRADFSLDQPPEDSDLERLAEIVLGYPNRAGSRILSADSKQHLLTHLLVLGYSGRDRRCILMLKYLMDTDPTFKLFWVCYDQRDVEHVGKVFSETEYAQRISIVRTRRPDLLLYELYQELTFCLPAGGFAYEFSHKIPPQPYAEENDDHAYKPTESQQAIADEIVKIVDQRRHIRATNNQDSNLLDDTYTSREGDVRLYAHPLHDSIGEIESEFDSETSVLLFDIETNAIKISNLVFDKMREKGQYCMWLEMQDHSNARYLVDDLFRTLSLWRGFHQIENLRYSVQLGEKAEGKHGSRLFSLCDLLPHFRNLLEYMGYGHVDKKSGLFTTDVVVFLYGRNVPGGCAAWGGVPWKNQQYRELASLLEILNQCGIRVIYMPFTAARQEREEQKREHDIPRLEKELRGQLGLHQMRANPASADEWNEYEQLTGKFDRNGLGRLGESVDSVNTLEYQPGSRRESRRYYDTLNSLINNFFSVAPKPDDSIGGQPIRGPSGDSDFDVDTIDRRFQFLYAVTLFRQSRHVSAFLSEAVFRCPYRFRGAVQSTETQILDQLTVKAQEKVLDKPAHQELAQAKQRRMVQKLSAASLAPIETISNDNDLIRKCVADMWIGILRSHGAFLYKAGSYVWKYRDVRLGLRALVDSNFEIDFDGVSLEGAESRPQRGVEFPGQLRSRTHLWIADWYRNAFFSSGHAHPLIESIHHYMQAIVYARVASPTHRSIDDLLLYRRVLATSACNELRKLIRIATPWIPLWIHVHESDPFFSHESSVAKTVNDLANNYSDDDEWRKFLEPHLKRVLKDIQLIGGVLRESSQVFSLLTGPTAESREVTLQVGKQVSFTSSSFLSRFKGQGTWYAKIREQWIAALRRKVGLDEDDVHVLEMFIGEVLNGANKSREKDVDLDSLCEALNESVKRHYQDLMRVCIKQPDHALALANSVSELGYALLKRAKLEIFAKDRDHRDTGGWRNVLRRMKLMQACCCFNLAWRLLYLTPPEHIGTEMELRIKNDSLYGLALGYLDRPFEAHRHLNQAMALLSKTQSGLAGIQLAMIRLRRAELFLALSKKLRVDLCDQVDKLDGKSEGEPKLRERLARVSKQFFAALDDTVAHLDYAEDTLAGIGHSNLWWGRCLSLRLRVYSVLPSHKVSSKLGIDNYEPLLFRKRTQHDAEVRELFRRLLNTTVHDNYRRLRALDYFIRALQERHADADFTIRKSDLTLASETVDKIEVKNNTLLGSIKNNIKGRLALLESEYGHLL